MISGAGLCWQHVGGVGSTTTTTTLMVVMRILCLLKDSFAFFAMAFKYKMGYQ